MKPLGIKQIRLAATAAFAWFASSCGGDPTGSNNGDLRVLIDPPQVEVNVGNTTTLRAIVRNASGNPVQPPALFWSTTDTSLVTVSADGVVTGRKVGLARVFASIPGGDAVASVNVVAPPVASVAVSPVSASVLVGAVLQLTATVKDASGADRTDRTVFWTSDNEAVASVASLTGAVTGRAAGTARITATVDGRAATATITVTTPPAPSQGPAASFVFSCTNLQCTFTDASTDRSGSLVAWGWNFGDGLTSPFRNSDHPYTTPGSYTVTLTVTNDKGTTNSTTRSVQPTARPTGPTAGVRLVNRSSGRCLSVQGSSSDRGAQIIARPCDGGIDQRFALPVGEGVGAIQLLGFDNRYLQLDQQDEKTVNSWTWNGAQYQRWMYTTNAQLRNYVTDTCMRDVGSGVAVPTVSCATAADQQWDARQ